LLAEEEQEADAQALRRATYSGQPLGDEGFIEVVRPRRESQLAGRPQEVKRASEAAWAAAAS
jgi:hypothetical protein